MREAGGAIRPLVRCPHKRSAALPCVLSPIKVTLLGTSPPVWRRVLVQRDITLHNLHKTLQTVMGWTNSHLHQFVFKRQRYSDPKHDLERRGESAKDFSIAVGGRSPNAIRFHNFLNPEATFYGLSDAGRWAVYSKLKAVFDARRFIIKNAILGLPEWLRFLLSVVAVWGVFPLLAYLHARWFVYIAYMVFLGLIAFVVFRPSRVFICALSRSLQTGL